MMNPIQVSPPPDCQSDHEQDLLPLQQIQITNHLPAEARCECQRLFEELLRQVVLQQNPDL